MAGGFGDHSSNVELFDRLGGRVFIALIAEKFCDRLLSDPKFDGLLATVDPSELKKETTELACEFLAGDARRVRVVLPELARHVDITESIFNRGISHMIAAFVWAGVNRENIEAVLELVTPLSAHLIRDHQAKRSDPSQ